MMRFMLLLTLLQLSFGCRSTDETLIVNESCKSTFDTLINQKVYVFVDEMPEHPGGMKELALFFANNFSYPSQTVFQDIFEMEFIIDTQGNVKGTRIRNKSISEYTEADKAALRVLNFMAKWKPGKCRGKTVPVRFYFPVRL